MLHAQRTLLLALVMLLASAFGVWGQTPQFTPALSMDAGRSFHSATLLNDGRVFIFGGYSTDNFNPIATALIYNPADNSFFNAGTANIARWGHSAILLNDGRVIIVGGNTACCSPNYVAQTEIYDPTTNQFAFGPTLPQGRGGAASSIVPLVKLSDGTILVVGGFRPDICGIPTQAVYRIDVSATFVSDLGSPLLVPHGGPASVAVLLQTGEVLVTGMKGSCLASPGPPFSELYNPVKNTSRLTAGDLLSERILFGGVLLNDGRYILVGGANGLGMPVPMEVYDPATETFTNTGNLDFLATDIVATLLQDGSALLTGNTAPPFAAMLNPADLSFTEVFPAMPHRRYHTATRLQDGRVFIAGGEVGRIPTSSTEIFGISGPAPNQPPVAQAGENRNAILGESVEFDSAGSQDPDGTITGFQWDFGDGTSALGGNVNHVYSAAGAFAVTLTVTDDAGASATDTITVTIQTPAQAVQVISEAVRSFNLSKGISNALDTKLENAADAMEALNAGNREDAEKKLQAFINAVEAQRGKELTEAQADLLVAATRRILAVL